MELRQREQGK